MSSSRTDISQIAARYATALFSLADADKALDAVVSDLAVLADAVRGDAALARLLDHPLLSRAAKAEAVCAVLAAQGAHALTLKAVERIAEGGRLAALPAIYDAFAALLADARGIVHATVISARALTKQEESAIAQQLRDALGKEVVLGLKQDASLIGGLKIRLGSKELDMSIAARLDQIKRALLAA